MSPRTMGIIAFMEPELMGALVGAGAGAFVGGLALYGALRQARAAHRAAEIAAQAAQRAAEVTAQAAKTQWRSQTQRDAAVGFVLAVETQLETARAVRRSPRGAEPAELAQLRPALLQALAVVQLEGPQPLADYASRLHAVVNSITLKVLARERSIAPVLTLREAADDGDAFARQALNRIQVSRGGNPDPAFWRDLRGRGLVPPEQLRVLQGRVRRRINGRPMSPDPDFKFGDAYREARDMLRDFTDAVRDHLDAQAAPVYDHPESTEPREINTAA